MKCKQKYGMQGLFLLLFLMGFVGFSDANPSPANEGDKILWVVDYGAVGDGSTLATEAIQQAIDHAHKLGGGRVVVSPGTFLTGGIEIKSNVTFEVQAGATLLGTDQLDQYATHAGTNQHGKPIQRKYLISILNATNVTLCGQGTIDGQGKVYWETPQNPPPQWIKAKADRPNALVEVGNSQNVVLRDITLTNSPNWTCHIMHSQDISIENLKIKNDLFAPNADGIDITGSQRIRVSNCDISTCDDAIVLKTWMNGQSCEDITVTNCVLETLCAALKLGTESYADFRRVVFSNCTVKAASRLFAIYMRDGGTVEDVSVSNIVGSTRAPLVLNRPIQIMLNKRTPESPLGFIKNVRMSQFSCETDGRILLTSSEKGHIEDVVLKDFQLRFPFVEDPAAAGVAIKSSQFPKMPRALVARAAIVAVNMERFVCEDFSLKGPGNAVPESWKYPLRIINGDFNKKFKYDYSQPKPVTLKPYWTEGLSGSKLAKPSFNSL